MEGDEAKKWGWGGPGPRNGGLNHQTEESGSSLGGSTEGTMEGSLDAVSYQHQEAQEEREKRGWELMWVSERVGKSCPGDRSRRRSQTARDEGQSYCGGSKVDAHCTSFDSEQRKPCRRLAIGGKAKEIIRHNVVK